jgi:hypothetical protein
MADGSEKKIEEVKKGEFVLTADPETGELQARQVTATITGDGVKHLVTLTVDPDGKDGEAKPSKITATAGHAFWLPDYGRWAEAGDLAPGAWLQTAAGTWAQVTAVDDTHRGQRVHNLSVEGQRTFFVLAGGTELLVHNEGVVPLNCPASELAQISMAARMENGVAAGQNVAVYRIGSGADARYLAAANVPKGKHSEEVLDAYLNKNGISPDDVTGIYSERQPCTDLKHMCAVRVGRYKNAANDIGWSLNPDGPGWSGFNKAKIREAMDGYSPASGLPTFEWIT